MRSKFIFKFKLRPVVQRLQFVEMLEYSNRKCILIQWKIIPIHQINLQDLSREPKTELLTISGLYGTDPPDKSLSKFN